MLTIFSVEIPKYIELQLGAEKTAIELITNPTPAIGMHYLATTEEKLQMSPIYTASPIELSRFEPRDLAKPVPPIQRSL